MKMVIAGIVAASVAVLLAGCSEQRPYSQIHTEFHQSVEEQVAVLNESSRRFREVEVEFAEARALFRAAEASLKAEQVARIVVRRLKKEGLR
jgi:hypothetical protein